MSKSRFDRVSKGNFIYTLYVSLWAEFRLQIYFLIILYSSNLKISAFSENLGHAGMYITYMPVKLLTSTTQELIFFYLTEQFVSTAKKKKWSWNEKAEKRARWV